MWFCEKQTKFVIVLNVNLCVSVSTKVDFLELDENHIILIAVECHFEGRIWMVFAILKKKQN